MYSYRVTVYIETEDRDAGEIVDAIMRSDLQEIAATGVQAVIESEVEN